MACMVGQPPAAGAKLSDGVASVPGPAALKGAVEVRIDGPRVVDGRAFPLVLGPARAAAASPADRTAFVSQEREALVACLRRHGAVVLRGWGPTSTSRDFADVVAALCEDAHGGMACSAGVRLTVVDGGATHAVVTANEAPPEDTIPFHHEMAQCSSPPKYICFFCEREPATGGATPLVLSRHVTAYLRATFPDLYARLKARGVRYTRVMPRLSDGTSALGKGWTVAYGVETRAALEAQLDAEGFAYRWLAGDFVETVSPALAPFRRDATGAENFFLAAETTFKEASGEEAGGTLRPTKGIRYGDGAQLSADDLAALRDVGAFIDARKVAFAWRHGDCLLIENSTAMHARATFTGPRRILACMAGNLDDA